MIQPLIEILKHEDTKITDNFPVLYRLEKIEFFWKNQVSTITPKNIQLDLSRDRVKIHLTACSNNDETYSDLDILMIRFDLNYDMSGYNSIYGEYKRYKETYGKNGQTLELTLDVYRRP